MTAIKKHFFVDDPDRDNLLFGDSLDRAVAADGFRNRFDQWMTEHKHEPRSWDGLVDCAQQFAIWSGDDSGLAEYLERMSQAGPAE